MLYRVVDKTILTTIMPAKTATEAWRNLEIKYRCSEEVILFKLQSLYREFDNLLMAENETIHLFFDRVTNIVYQIRSNGSKIEDENVIRQILRVSHKNITLLPLQ